MKKVLLLSMSILTLCANPFFASASTYLADNDDDQSSGYEWPDNNVNVDETDFDDPTYDANNDSDDGSVEIPADENDGSSEDTSEDEE